MTNPLAAEQTSNDNHPSTNPAFIAAHRSAFSELPSPTALTPGDRVWIWDHYYPGIVRLVSSTGRATVEMPEWDYERCRPLLTAEGHLVTSTLHYATADYGQLRVDVASAAFWPTPANRERIEA